MASVRTPSVYGCAETMCAPKPISETFNARIASAELDRRYVVVDSAFAARLTTEHTETLEIDAVRTATGDEVFTRDIPNVGEEDMASLDARGLAKLGVAVRPGVLLVGKVTPTGGAQLNPEEKLLRAIFGEKAGELRNSSLRTPPGMFGTVRAAAFEADPPDALHRARVTVGWERALEIGDVVLIGGEQSTVADIRPIDDADLAWSGGRSNAPVAKLANARDVLHARSIGPYTPILQQPSVGLDAFGGQVVERHQAALFAEHAPWVLFEMLTYKADAMVQRMRAYEALVKGESPRAVG